MSHQRPRQVRFWAAVTAFAFFLTAVALGLAPNQALQQTGRAIDVCSSFNVSPASAGC